MVRRRYIQAINDAMFEEMERDENVIVFGEDVELSIFSDLRGLVDKFGRDRIRNTPISEATITGMALGATAGGFRVVVHMMFANFVFTGFDAIANQITKMRLMTGGQLEMPITFICGYGGGRGSAAQHSDSIHSTLLTLGGLKIAMPSNAADAKGMLKSCIRDPNPCFFLEATSRGGTSNDIPDGDHLVPLGKAAVAREGRDVTIVALGTMVAPALEAAEALSAEGIEAEVIDLRSLVPLDEEAILRSVAKTRRLVITDESRERGGASAYVAALVADKGFNLLAAPIRRVNWPNIAVPYAPKVERHLMPTSDKIADAARQLVAGKVTA